MMAKPKAGFAAFVVGLTVCCAGDGAENREEGSKLWSLSALRRPAVLPAPDNAWCRNPIDFFILKKLRENGLKPAPEADRRVLIRRLSYDLIGLPPSPEEVEAFVHDHSSNAYERLVERLLASPHYGERWGRHWLDLVRFAETHGYERDDPKPNAWRYRDWVINAWNQDLPYNRFLLEQLAGDELPDASPESRTATGMYRVGLIDDEPADALMDRFDQLDDVIKTVGTTMLGLTIHCARCHDHKFDPITQHDYYALLAFFSPSQRYVRNDASSIELEIATPQEKEQFQAKTKVVEEKLQLVQKQLEALRKPVKEAIVMERRGKLSQDALAVISTPADQRSPAQKKLVDDANATLQVKAEEITARLSPAEKGQQEALEREVMRIGGMRPPALTRTLGLTDAGSQAQPTMLLVRGDAHHPGANVTPAFLSAVTNEPPVISPPAQGKTTGRRLALARWITNADNPLTARVMVNRLWQHHFGQGIVGTPSDFGTMGEEPTHPELLDWLATEFIARGWSLKAMHRLIVTSATYRQSGQWDESAAATDVANSCLWRMSPRRLEAEPIRDAILQVSGSINLSLGGPSVTPPIDKVVLAGQSRPGSGWGTADDRSANRRSIYVHVKRSLPLPELEVLDAADNSEPCPRRSVTTTAPQALTLFNGTFLHEQAAKFADRLQRDAKDSPADRVERAFTLAFGRKPTASEARDACEFLTEMEQRIQRRPNPNDRKNPAHEALRAFCLVILNSNEFLTID